MQHLKLCHYLPMLGRLEQVSCSGRDVKDWRCAHRFLTLIKIMECDWGCKQSLSRRESPAGQSVRRHTYVTDDMLTTSSQWPNGKGHRRNERNGINME